MQLIIILNKKVRILKKNIFSKVIRKNSKALKTITKSCCLKTLFWKTELKARKLPSQKDETMRVEDLRDFCFLRWKIWGRNTQTKTKTLEKRSKSNKKCRATVKATNFWKDKRNSPGKSMKERSKLWMNFA